MPISPARGIVKHCPGQTQVSKAHYAGEAHYEHASPGVKRLSDPNARSVPATQVKLPVTSTDTATHAQCTAREQMEKMDRRNESSWRSNHKYVTEGSVIAGSGSWHGTCFCWLQ